MKTCGRDVANFAISPNRSAIHLAQVVYASKESFHIPDIIFTRA